MIAKKDKALQELKNWRPITLLNCDYKIASKAIASRLKAVLQNLIDNDQTGLSIAENICLINNVISYTETKNIPGLLLFVDFEKAIDTTEWAFVEKTLQHFGFGSSLIRGGAVASWLVRLTPERAVRVRVLARDSVLCSWARHFTLTVPLSTQVYKWVHVFPYGLRLTYCSFHVGSLHVSMCFFRCISLARVFILRVTEFLLSSYRSSSTSWQWICN